MLACSDSSSTALDGSVCVSTDASLDGAIPDGGIVYPAMNRPHPPEQACTQAELANYAQCQANKDTDLCKAFAVGGASATCGACLESQASDATWGVLVFNQQAGSFNIEGCVDLELNQVAQECNQGAPNVPKACSCGEALHLSYECQEQANAQLCNTCTDSDSSALCASFDLAGLCASQDQAVMDPNGFCAALFSDAAPQGALDCFPDAAIVDPAAQELQWLETVGAIFCNAPP